MILGTGTLLLAATVGGGAAGSAATVVAQAVADPGSGFGPGTFANLGLTGLLTMVIFTASRTVYANLRADLAESRAELKDARAELKELNGKIMGEYAPTLTRATDLMLTVIRGDR